MTITVFLILFCIMFTANALVRTGQTTARCHQLRNRNARTSVIPHEPLCVLHDGLVKPKIILGAHKASDVRTRTQVCG